MLQRKDLVDIGDADYNARRSEYIQCLDCGIQSGGTRGDFWQIGMEDTFQCHCGSKNLILVRDLTETVIVKQ